MKFSIIDEIPYPRALVFETHRDKISEIVPYLPNVASVVVEHSEVDGSVVRQINRWTGESHDIPALLRPLIRPEVLTWLDRANWYQDKWMCDWELELAVLPKAITARGYNVFLEEGEETIIQMNGEFTIHPDRMVGASSILARQIAPAVERFIVGLLEPNLRQGNRAVLEYLEDNE